MRVRDVSSLPRLDTAEAVVAFLRDAPNDRFINMDNDLTPDDWSDESPCALRVDNTIWVVMSLSAARAGTFKEFVRDPARLRVGYTYGIWPGEVAVMTPAVGEMLAREAEEGYPDRNVSRGPFDGIWVLPDHPEAETDEQIREQMRREFGGMKMYVDVVTAPDTLLFSVDVIQEPGKAELTGVVSMKNDGAEPARATFHAVTTTGYLFHPCYLGITGSAPFEWEQRSGKSRDKDDWVIEAWNIQPGQLAKVEFGLLAGR